MILIHLLLIFKGSNLTKEYFSFKLKKQENSLPLLKKTLADLGINPKPRPWVRHTNDEMEGV